MLDSPRYAAALGYNRPHVLIHTLKYSVNTPTYSLEKELSLHRGMVYRVVGLTEINESDVEVLPFSPRLLDQRRQDEDCICSLPPPGEPKLRMQGRSPSRSQGKQPNAAQGWLYAKILARVTCREIGR